MPKTFSKKFKMNTFYFLKMRKCFQRFLSKKDTELKATEQLNSTKCTEKLNLYVQYQGKSYYI